MSIKGFIAEVIVEVLVGFPSLPKDSHDAKRRKKAFITSIVATLIAVGLLAGLTYLHAVRII